MDGISLIVAASANNVIGAGGALPWRLSDDLRRFKAVTMGKPVVMGRKTYESIGRPLPGRHNIVVSRNARFRAGGCTVVTSVDHAVVAAGDAEEVMVIGGEQIYRMFLPLADRVYLTRVHADVKGDARFPELDDATWSLVGREERAADADNEFAFTFEIYKRVR